MRVARLPAAARPPPFPELHTPAMGEAERVLEAFTNAQLIAPFSDDDPAFDEAAGYAVARAVHEQRIAGGLRPIGRKVGFTNRFLWPQFDIWAPIWGHVYDATTVTGDAEVAIEGLLQPLVEPEVQLHFATTPPRTRDEEAILACIDWIALGFEIV